MQKIRATKQRMLETMEDQIYFEGEDYFSDHMLEYDDIVAELESRSQKGMLDDFLTDYENQITTINGHKVDVTLLFQAIVTTAVDEAVYTDHPGQSVKDVFFKMLALRGGQKLLDTLGFCGE